ncbi:MAG: agmatinase [Solirubrobacteraceae bacterium]|jgi:agmatinase|nr:agmatinase [Solirubrobacteraceae bacterium]
MIDPLERWRQYGEKPDYAGFLSYGGAVCTQDPAELAGFDVAIVGAPTDDLVSDRPGARYGPRAIRAASCPPGPHLEAGVDAFAALRIVDFGDAPVLPADPLRSHAAIEETVGQVLAAGAIPVTLGGDHAITEPAVRACAAVHGPVGMVHFDTHTDTGTEVFGVEISHGTFIRRLVHQGAIDPARYAQIGLRGYWPGEAEFGWQAERGITSLFAHDVRDLGIREVVRRAVAAVGAAGPVYLTVDVDVLDPAFLGGGTGTPEPGGMSSTELLLAVRTVATELDLVGVDVVEVIPTAVGSADLSALVADRIVREALTGLALRRGARA